MTGTALVTEKSGKLWLLDTATGRKQQVAGVPAVKEAGQGGLGDVVAHPDFAGNQRVYLSFVEGGSGRTSGAVVGYGRLILGQGQPRLEGFKVIWRQSPKVGGDVLPSKLITASTCPFCGSPPRNQLNATAEPSGANCGVTAYCTASVKLGAGTSTPVAVSQRREGSVPERPRIRLSGATALDRSHAPSGVSAPNE